jgi:hypothetical protein
MTRMPPLPFGPRPPQHRTPLSLFMTPVVPTRSAAASPALLCRAAALFLTLACTSRPLAAQPSPAPQIPNGGFEIATPAASDHPADWRVDGVGPAYGLDHGVYRSGAASLHIAFKTGSNAEGYSGAIQQLDAAPFRGRRIEYTAYVRRSSARSKVGIWLLVPSPDPRRRVYINSYEQPIANDSTWSLHTLTMTVPRTATTIAFGTAIYENDGEMWVDDVSVRILPAKR